MGVGDGRTAKLDHALAAVCSIHGVSIGRWNDRATWRIDFKDEATKAERAAAQKVLASFVPQEEKPAVSELDELKAALVAKGVLSEADLK